ncbi:MAG: hypothetical protein QOK43_1113 [Acidimicrobiaceae bacterium]|nr:hypothetical protein [Acidimicrobiaceae bacterium]
MIAAVAVVQKARLAKALVPILGSVVLLPVVLLGAAGGALMGGGSSQLTVDGTAAWGGDLPAEMAALYAEAAYRFVVPLGVLEAVGKVETDHCRNPLAMTPNSAGAVGCMQFLPSTFERWASASGSAAPSILDPRDSVFASAAKLSADGVAADPWQALWAYNHSDSYVADVLAWAVAYGWRGGSRALLGRAVAGHARIAVRPSDAADLAAELVDERVLSTLLALATRHRLASVGPFTRHSHYVHGTSRVSNHVFGRAVDVAVVGGAPVDSGNDAARRLVVDALTLPDDIRPSEVLSPWELRVGDAWSVTDADHGNHVHLGFDGRSER